jgi:DHA1 family bicyclomycin/chloramphenicol resistance-like MFS transporter
VAPDLPVLVGGRLVQGFAGAGGIVLGRAIIADTSDERTAARAFSVLMTVGALAPVLAPVLGGVVAVAGGWRGVFAVLTVVAVAMCVGAVVLLPESLPPARRDSAAWSTTLRRAGRALSRRRFIGSTAVVVFSYGALIADVSGSSFVLQEQYALTPAGYALAFAANAAGLTLASVANARLLRRAEPRRLLVLGLGVQTVAAAVLVGCALVGVLSTPLLLLLLWVGVTAVGFVVGNATAAALAEAPRERGTASAVVGAAQFALAAAIAPIAGTGSAVAMTSTMTVCAAVAVLTLALTVRAGRVAPEPSLTSDT